MYSLETPSVSAKAYPGVNVVSWKPVTGAKSYKVTVYEEGAYKRDLYTISGNSGWDTDLKNGKNYTYYVEAVSSTNPGTADREAYAMNSRGEASVKAIVPPANTKSLELPAYEGGYDGKNVKTVSENDEWVVKPANIKAEVLNDKVYVSFPMKAYLNYNVKYYNNDLPHDKNVNDGTTITYYGDVQVISDKNANNVVGKTSFTITSAGKHQIAVVAKACGDYADSDEVVREELVTIEKLNVKQYNSVTAEYVLADDKFANAADKKVRVSFKPAIQNDNGNKVPTSWYTVYRRVVGEYENTALDGKVSVDETGNYYIEEEVDVAKSYVYTVVLSNGGKYGNAEVSNTLTRGNEDNYLSLDDNIGELNAAYVLTDNKFVDGASKLIRVSFTPAKKDGKDLPTECHKVYRKVGDEAVFTPLAATVKASDDTAADNTTVTYYFEDTVSDVTKDYTYKVVVTNKDGTKYGEITREKTVDAESKEYIDSIEIVPDFDQTTKKVTWEISGAGNATLSAKYLIVENRGDDETEPEVPVLANEILENGKSVNLAQKKGADGKVVAGAYTAVLENPTFTVAPAYIYLVVQATLDGYNKTNVISARKELTK